MEAARPLAGSAPTRSVLPSMFPSMATLGNHFRLSQVKNKFSETQYCFTITVADQHSKILDDPKGSKFFHFHAVFGKIWQNRMLAPSGGLATHLGEILDPPLNTFRYGMAEIIIFRERVVRSNHHLNLIYQKVRYFYCLLSNFSIEFRNVIKNSSGTFPNATNV